MGQGDPNRVSGFRSVMEEFLKEQLEPKLKQILNKLEKEEDPEKRVELSEKRDSLVEEYGLRSWVEKAAALVVHIDAATHILKATDSHAKGTNLYCPPASLTPLEEVGSCHLDESFAVDFTNNSARFVLYKFLSLEYEGVPLFKWFKIHDKDLCEAIGCADSISDHCSTFGSISELGNKLASHERMKQIYWLTGEDPVEDADFTILAPMYSSSLAHEVYGRISEHKYSDNTKAARAAKRKNEYCEYGIHEYPHLGIQKLGGTKPQNVSQLNSERGGRNYLLASLPPVWMSRSVRPPYGRRPLFEQFGLRRDTQAVLKRFQGFLESDPPANMTTRIRRDEYLDQLLGEFSLYCGDLHALDPCWSADPKCSLVECEVMLLDPGRYARDADFAARFREKYASRDWTKDISNRFANWLNGALGGKLPLEDAEQVFWSDVFREDVMTPLLKNVGEKLKEEAHV
jgi:CRISPR-associated protein Csy1